MITIRRIQIGEVELFKQIRLQSLREAPYAFASTYEEALLRSDESWREQADGTAIGPDRATFFAFSGDLPIGMAALYRDQDRVADGELLQVWVSPEYRGTQVILDLMDEIFRWAKENEFRRIFAGVAKANTRALKFYLKYGFAIMEEFSDGVYLVKEVKQG